MIDLEICLAIFLLAIAIFFVYLTVSVISFSKTKDREEP